METQQNTNSNENNDAINTESEIIEVHAAEVSVQPLDADINQTSNQASANEQIFSQQSQVTQETTNVPAQPVSPAQANQSFPATQVGTQSYYAPQEQNFAPQQNQFPNAGQPYQGDYYQNQAQYGQTQGYPGQYGQTQYGQTQYTGQQSYTYEQPQQVYGQPINTYVAANQATYPMTETDRTLRLVAFVFMVISLASVGWLIIPLAWMIPMTVYSWGIYKGTRANSVAFGVCTLLFCSLVAGILLLISNKDK